MNRDALKPRALPPVNFPAWAQTRTDFATAIASGARLIVVSGADGSGKTYTLRLYQMTLPGRRIGYRLPGDPAAASLEMDLVDAVDPAVARHLAAELPETGIRILATGPEATRMALQAAPGALVVRVHPMVQADVAAMVQARCVQLEVEEDAFLPEALEALHQAGDGTPRRLDRLFGAALRIAIEAGADKVDRAHVDAAAQSNPLPPSTGAADLPGEGPVTPSATVRHPSPGQSGFPGAGHPALLPRGHTPTGEARLTMSATADIADDEDGARFAIAPATLPSWEFLSAPYEAGSFMIRAVPVRSAGRRILAYGCLGALAAAALATAAAFQYPEVWAAAGLPSASTLHAMLHGAWN